MYNELEKLFDKACGMYGFEDERTIALGNALDVMGNVELEERMENED